MQRVRPTKRALSDMGLDFPPLTESLSTIKHVVVRKSQDLPRVHEAGAVERIRAITDRSIYKVKVDDWRAATVLVAAPAEVTAELDVIDNSEAWWTVAAGHRKSDTPQQDFYERLTEECRRAAKNTPARVNSSPLLPKLVDYRRLAAESAALAVENIKFIVRHIICRSAETGMQTSHEVAKHTITASVQLSEGDTYLAITAEGFVAPEALAIILDAVPGVPKDAWGAEPGEVLGIVPQRDQLVFSTILPPEVLAAMLDEHKENPSQ